MANNDKNFKVKNGLDVKGGATIDNDLLVSGTLTAQVNTPTQDSDVVNKHMLMRLILMIQLLLLDKLTWK